jgi:hypothetical protein
MHGIQARTRDKNESMLMMNVLKREIFVDRDPGTCRKENFRILSSKRCILFKQRMMRFTKANT